MRKDAHHIQIKNLRTGQEEGFMLTSGDKPFTVQGVDTIATRISEWEILYSDFTNSRVFAQSEWSGGISKYWVPERIYSVIYPTLKYADAYNADVSKEGEFTIGASAYLAKDFPNPTSKFSSATNGEAAGVVYAGVKGELKIWRSVDHGLTWSVYLDLTVDSRLTGCDEITDIQFVKNKGGQTYSNWTNQGKGLEQIWFIAWNNSAGTGKVCRTFKGLYISSLALNNGYARSPGQTAFINKNVWFQYEQNQANLNHSVNFKTWDSATRNVYVTWNWDEGKDEARLEYQGELYLPFQSIEIYEWSTWNTYRIRSVYSWAVGFSWYNWWKTSGNFNVRLKASPTEVVLPTGTSIYIYGDSTYTNITNGPMGYMTTIGWVKYTIVWFADYASWVGGYWYFVSDKYVSQNSIVMPGCVCIKRSDGAAIDTTDASLFSNVSRSFSGFSEVQVSDLNNALSGCKKLMLIQDDSHEEIFGLRPADTYASILGNQYPTGGVYRYQNNNLYSYNFWNNSNAYPYLYYNGQAVGLPIGHYASAGCNSGLNFTGYLGTQLGTNEAGVEAKLCKIECPTEWTTTPILTELTVIGEQAISAMVYDYDKLWIATNLDGSIYTYTGSNIIFLGKMPTIDGVTNNYIDSIASYNGKIVCSYQNGPGVYVLDPNTFYTGTEKSIPVIIADILCTLPGKTASQTFRITKLLSTGVNLLIGTNDAEELFYYNRAAVGTSCNITSSIYGGYISNVEKLWLYAYMRVEPWTSDDGQSVRLQMSFDEGNTWYWLPTKKNTAMLTSPVSFTDYEHKYVAGDRNDQFLFFYPPNTLSNTIQYRTWLYKGTTYKPVCNHISCHFMINYRQELLFNYNLQLVPTQETLDGRHIDKRTTQDKLDFLKEIWMRQDICEITHVDGKVYTALSFSDDRTPWQGLVMQAQNANAARFDKENLAYNILFTFKTIANYESTI